MKKTFRNLLIITAAFLCIAVSSCNAPKQAITYIKKHCTEQKQVIDPQTGSFEIQYLCDSLWDSKVVGEKCSEITACVNGAKGSFTFHAKCDSTVNLKNLPNIFKKVSKK